MTAKQYTRNFKVQLLTILSLIYSSPLQAQIIPDGTTPFNLLENTEIRDELGDLIQQGTQVDNLLFHSLQDFNVLENQRVYFENPVAVDHILTRITGDNPSQIFGTLGIDGAANLYLSNGQGFIFGENSALDIEGSFVATTGNIDLGDGQVFGKSTDIPQNILEIQVPLGLQYGTHQGGEIINRGKLEAAQDLVLAAKDLNLEGEITAGRDLLLLGNNSVKIRDSETNPFTATSFGNLSIQGNQEIDIFALNHAESGLFSLGDMNLRSNNPISGDAHYFSGGRFSTQDMSGNPGDLISLNDPIISSHQDVIIGNYEGASLKIESKGSILTGDINITDPDTGLIDNPNDPDIAILKNSPALILRAGVDELKNPANPLLFRETETLYFNDFELEDVAGDEWSDQSTETTPIGERRFLGLFKNTPLNLTLDQLSDHQSINISFDLYLAKSWDGNDPELGASDDVWQLRIDDNRNLLNTTFSNLDTRNKPQSFPKEYDPSDTNIFPAFTGASEVNTLGYRFRGDITDSVYNLEFNDVAHSNDTLELDFQGQGLNDESWGIDNVEISTTRSLMPLDSPTSLGTITSENIVTFGGPAIISATDDINLRGITTFGGDIDIKTTGGDVFLDSQYNTTGGNLKIRSTGSIDITESSIRTFSTRIGGNVELISGKRILLGNISSSGREGGGNILLEAEQDIVADGLLIIRSDTFNSGVGGQLDIDTNNLMLKNGARILTGSENGGTGGDINVTAELVELSGSGVVPASSSTELTEDLIVPTVISTTTANEDDAGNIVINTKKLVVRDGATGIGTATVSSGQAGNLTVNASESIELIGSANAVTPIGLSSDTVDIDSFSDISSEIDGDAGNIFVNTRRLIVRNGAVISSSTFNSGKGGNVLVEASESIQFKGTSVEGFASGLYAQSFGTGDAGSITVKARELQLSDNATITARTATVDETNFPKESPFVELFNVIFPDSASGKAGNIDISADDVNLLGNAEILASTSGDGDSGQINLNVANTLFAQDGSIQTSSEKSSGGLINIRAKDIRLLGDSDITTSVFSGVGGGGNIRLTANSILAFDDSDILAFARDGQGGNIFLITPGFFGENYQPAPRGTDPETLDFNDRVDINASGAVNGLVQLPDVSFIDNSLTDLPEDLVDTDSLLSQSCLAQSAEGEGRFTISGSGGLASRPGDMPVSYYSLEDEEKNALEDSSAWNYGDLILEPTGIYELNGQWVMARKCN